MIIVDTALGARGTGQADPGRHGRRRLHGRRASRTRSSTRAGHAPGRALEPRPGSEPRTSSLCRPRAGLVDVPGSVRGGGRGRAGRLFDRRPVPAVAFASTSTCSVDIDRLRRVRRPVMFEAFGHGKHVVLMNAEIDATDRPHPPDLCAQRMASILSACDGDEPGVQMNLYRWVMGLGPHPARHRQRQGTPGPVPDPDDAAELRRSLGPVPRDGHVVRRRLEDQLRAGDRRERHGLHGPRARACHEGSSTRRRHGDRRALRRRRAPRARGVVDYVVGTPLTKVYVPCRAHRSEAAALPRALQDGAGPALFVLHPVPPRPLRGSDRDRSRGPLPGLGCEAAGGPVVEVCAVAKRDLEAGETLDEYGMYTTYGEAVNADEMSRTATCRKDWSRVPAAAGLRARTGAHLRRRRIAAGRGSPTPQGRAVPSSSVARLGSSGRREWLRWEGCDH